MSRRFRSRSRSVLLGLVSVASSLVLCGWGVWAVAETEEVAPIGDLARERPPFRTVDADREPEPEGPNLSVLAVETYFGIPVAYDGALTGSRSARVPTRNELERAALPILEELSKYPEETLRWLRVARLVLCADLREGERPLHGYVSGSVIILDVSCTSDVCFRETIHHEIFHVIDRFGIDESRWQALNLQSFRYSAYAAAMVGELPYGFVSRYSMTAPGEDRAEIFGLMMTDPLWFRDLCELDPVLEIKAEVMREEAVAYEPAFDALFARL